MGLNHLSSFARMFYSCRHVGVLKSHLCIRVRHLHFETNTRYVDMIHPLHADVGTNPLCMVVGDDRRSLWDPCLSYTSLWQVAGVVDVARCIPCSQAEKGLQASLQSFADEAKSKVVLPSCPRESFCTSPSQLFTSFPNCHWFSAMTWRDLGAWSLAEVLRASCCKGLNTLQTAITDSEWPTLWIQYQHMSLRRSVAASLWGATNRMTRSQVKSARLAPFQLRSLPTFSFETSSINRSANQSLAFQIVLIIVISSIKLAMLQAAAPGNSTPSAGLDAGCTLS